MVWNFYEHFCFFFLEKICSGRRVLLECSNFDVWMVFFSKLIFVIFIIFYNLTDIWSITVKSGVIRQINAPFQVITSPMSDMRLVSGRGLLVLEWIKDMGQVVGQVVGQHGHVTDTSKMRVMVAVHRSEEGQLYRDVFSMHPCFTSYHPTVFWFQVLRIRSWACFFGRRPLFWIIFFVIKFWIVFVYSDPFCALQCMQSCTWFFECFISWCALYCRFFSFFVLWFVPTCEHAVIINFRSFLWLFACFLSSLFFTGLSHSMKVQYWLLCVIPFRLCTYTLVCAQFCLPMLLLSFSMWLTPHPIGQVPISSRRKLFFRRKFSWVFLLSPESKQILRENRQKW